MKKKIVIIGSGIAGLTLANLLKSNPNFEFTIYEKNENLNLEEGFGVQLSVNCITILNKIGFNNLDKNVKYHPLKLDFYSMNLSKLCDLDLTEFNSENKKYTTLKRSTLIKFLKDKLFSNSIIFRKKINSIEKINEKIQIFFEDGSNDITDYLIVSDGVFSNAKLIIEEKNLKPNYYGAIAIRNQISRENTFKLNMNNISLIMGSNAHIVLYPVNQHQDINLVCIIRKRLHENEDVEKILEKTVLKENKNLTDFFKGELKSWPIYTSKKPEKSIYKNVLYIGDAFYTFAPTIAQGASQAIESANEIFELLRENHKDIQNKYFINRLNRTNLINKRSKFNYFGFHIMNPLLKFVRNLVLKRLVRNKNFIRNYLGKIYR
tara:strand:- start:21578 stop:22708 length:1131 start_codon:yes stop_codon:yes gene_type:complete